VLTAAGRAERAETARSVRILSDRLCQGFDDAGLAIVVRLLEAVGFNFTKEISK
jgi:hypothetical protein